MASSAQILFALILLNFFLYGFVTATFGIPGVQNPTLSLFTSLNQNGVPSASGTGSAVTANNGNSTNLTPQQQNIASCGLGGVIGGVIGAFGFIAGPVGIATTAAGALIGCGITAAFAPQAGSNIVQWAINNLGPIGTFINVILTALKWADPIVTYYVQSIQFEVAIFSFVSPELSIFMAPLQGVTLIWFFREFANFVRGIGALG